MSMPIATVPNITGLQYSLDTMITGSYCVKIIQYQTLQQLI